MDAYQYGNLVQKGLFKIIPHFKDRVIKRATSPFD